jgi:hypothetical protein
VVKCWLVGAPMPLAQARPERLTKTVALAVFSSDTLSRALLFRRGVVVVDVPFHLAA